MKKCTKCEIEKEYDKFYKDKTAKDGYNCICKQCRLEMDRARRISDPEWAERRKKQNAEFHLKNRETIAERKKKWLSSEKGRESHRKSTQKYRERYPEKKMAQDAIYRSIKRGELMRPKYCQKCNVEGFTEAHHYSYDHDKRTTVLWLCKNCHENITRKNI